MTPEEGRRVEALEHRLDALERRLQSLENGGPAPGRRPASIPMQATPAVTEAPPPPRRTLETTFGLNWLSRIAVVTVVLALAFFFEYASENHWITEPMRVLLGVGCGAAALFFGDRFWRKGQRTYGQALAAAGIAFLFLSAWASFGLYHLVSPSAGFGLMVTITAAAGWLALRYDSPAVALLGLGGGFATPLLLGGSNPPWLVLSYALLLDAGAAFASRRRQWRWPEGLALLGTAILYCTQLPLSSGYALFLLAYYGLFASSIFLPVFLLVQALTGLAWAGLWGHGFAGMAGVWAIAASGLVLAGRRASSAGAAASFAGFWLAYAYYSAGTLDQVGGMLLISAAYLTFLAWPVWRIATREEPLRLLDVALIPLNALFYVPACSGLLHKLHAGIEGLCEIAAGIACLIAAWLLRRDRRGGMTAYVTGHGLVLLGLGVVTVDWVTRSASPQNYLSIASASVSVLAGAYAVLLVALGSMQRHTATRILGIGLFGMVVVKLYLYDVWLLAALYRMAAFAILGALLLTASFLYRQRTR